MSCFDAGLHRASPTLGNYPKRPDEQVRVGTGLFETIPSHGIDHQRQASQPPGLIPRLYACHVLPDDMRLCLTGTKGHPQKPRLDLLGLCTQKLPHLQCDASVDLARPNLGRYTIINGT